MSDGGDSKLVTMLRARRAPTPSADLAARIVREARRTPQQRPVSLAQALGEALERLFAELRLPRPAVALGAALIVGIAAGWAVPFDSAEAEAEDDVDVVHVESFLYPDEDVS